jgi:hypothetical protein
MAIGNLNYASGMVGHAFQFNGANSYVLINNLEAYQLQSFTIEAWIQRSDTNRASFDIFKNGAVLQYGWGGYGFALADDGRLLLSNVGVDAVFSNSKIRDTNFHHVAVSKSSNSVVFYIDGVADEARIYNQIFTFREPLAIGASGNGLACFAGLIDEVSLYNRPLEASEIQAIYSAGPAGKIYKTIIRKHPESQVAYIGATVTFTVEADGDEPLSYQWLKNGISVDGANNAMLVLTSAQMNDDGQYTVVISNSQGSILSNAALLSMSVAGTSINLYAGVQVQGVVGSTYGIQSTVDISQAQSWIGLTNLTLTQPSQLWLDLQPANQPKRFYRVVPGPISIP